MFLIVGLGNPGEEYEHTRHNAGFDAVDLIAEEVGARYWKTECGALTTKGVYRDHDLVLAKPQSYMNTSGGPVKQLMNAYGVDAEHLIVVHDELDIDPGTVRVKFGGGHAGHNGLRSICDKPGTRDWYRVRVGIGRPPVRFSRSLVPGWKFTSERPLPVISMYRAGVSRESATTRQTIPPMSEPMFSGIEKPPSWKAAKT